MEIGVLVSFGGVIPGKEKAAVDVFAETMKVYGSRLADGSFTSYEPFIFQTGDLQETLGFFVIKGPREKVMAYFDSDENRILKDKVSLIVNHLKIEFLYTGNEVLKEVQLLSGIAEKTPVLVG